MPTQTRKPASRIPSAPTPDQPEGFDTESSALATTEPIPPSVPQITHQASDQGEHRRQVWNIPGVEGFTYLVDRIKGHPVTIEDARTLVAAKLYAEETSKNVITFNRNERANYAKARAVGLPVGEVRTLPEIDFSGIIKATTRSMTGCTKYSVAIMDNGFKVSYPLHALTGKVKITRANLVDVI